MKYSIIYDGILHVIMFIICTKLSTLNILDPINYRMLFLQSLLVTLQVLFRTLCTCVDAGAILSLAYVYPINYLRDKGEIMIIFNFNRTMVDLLHLRDDW